ncbi:tetratricopeptide repeat protein [Robertkochia solimangrovi]|uniref:tetratricopeptide repeat protein n=1 Tax=Robertkochia solimangrovi TaxID=2213046 RepID=UPI00117E3134|nr:tetratricopeptide repeat protein [Robertkochia solimangrovi]TRZ42916.1 hypothetical protein DMZ48_12690 [Robertkochia solimangrovi]
MKKRILIASAVLFSTFAIAQKKELRDAEKALENGSVAEAKTALDGISGSIDAADEKYKSQYYFLLGKTYGEMGKKGLEVPQSYQLAAENLNKLIEFEKGTKVKYTEEAKAYMNQMANDLVNSAVEDNKNNKYAEGADKLYLAYELSGNADYLYYAASGAVQAEQYEKSLEYYLALKDMGYTGESTQYVATNKETGQVEDLGTESNRDLMVKAGTHINPEEQKTESRLPEIVKNIGLIYSQQGETEKAIAAMKDARAANPEDINLLLTEANLYIKLGDKEKFRALMEEAIQKDPNNPVLFYNLGVITAEQGDHEKAMEYYQRSLELDPKSENTYLNMASEVLSREQGIVDEMNGLGNTSADNKRYDELKGEREQVYRDAIPYLEKLLEINPNNVDATRTLMNIYGNIGETAKFKEMKDKLSTLEQ